MGGTKGIYIGPGRGGQSRGLARLKSAMTALLIGSAVIGLFIAALVIGSILAALLLIVVVVAVIVLWIKYLFRARRSRY